MSLVSFGDESLLLLQYRSGAALDCWEYNIRIVFVSSKVDFITKFLIIIKFPVFQIMPFYNIKQIDGSVLFLLERICKFESRTQSAFRLFLVQLTQRMQYFPVPPTHSVLCDTLCLEIENAAFVEIMERFAVDVQAL